MKAKKNLGGRPSQAETGQIETRILDAACDLFFSEGYGATSIDALATKACVSKRTFYDRYKDKPDVFRAVVKHVIGNMRPANADTLFAPGKLEDVLERVAIAMMNIMLSAPLISLHRLLLAEAPRFPELVQLVYEEGTRQEAVERIALLLSQEAKLKRITLNNPAFIAEQFVMMVIGAPQRRLMMGLAKPMTPRETKEWALNTTGFFLNGFYNAKD